jgi:hypothetical protein
MKVRLHSFQKDQQALKEFFFFPDTKFVSMDLHQKLFLLILLLYQHPSHLLLEFGQLSPHLRD